MTKPKPVKDLTTEEWVNRIAAPSLRKGETLPFIKPMKGTDLTCAECGGPPSGETQPSVDARWRLGHCRTCNKKSSIFNVKR